MQERDLERSRVNSTCRSLTFELFVVTSLTIQPAASEHRDFYANSTHRSSYRSECRGLLSATIDRLKATPETIVRILVELMIHHHELEEKHFPAEERSYAYCNL